MSNQIKEMTSLTETREAVARTEDLHRQVWDILWFKLSCNEDNGDCWIDGRDEAADAIIATHLAPRDAEIESLRARAEAAEKVLIGQTPDGSEYHSKDADGYRVDVQRCARFITEDRASKRDLIRKTILAKNAALSEVSRLTAALAESERQGAVMREALAKTKTHPALKAPTWDEAVTLALRAIHDTDGRGMIARGRNHLHERVAREIFNATRALVPSRGNDEEAR